MLLVMIYTGKSRIKLGDKMLIFNYSAHDKAIPAQSKVLVDTDISLAIPEGHYGRVAPRSGLAAKHHIDTGAGVIDSDYRGPLKVLLFNLGQEDYEGKHVCAVRHGMRC